MKKVAKELKALNIKPLGNRVVIEIDEPPGSTKAGIILPQNANRRSQKGTVVAVGEGKTLPNGNLVSFSMTPGTRVIFKQFAEVGSEFFEFGDKKHTIIDADDVLAVILD